MKIKRLVVIRFIYIYTYTYKNIDIYIYMFHFSFQEYNFTSLKMLYFKRKKPDKTNIKFYYIRFDQLCR